MRKKITNLPWKPVMWIGVAILAANLGRMVYTHAGEFRALAASTVPYTVVRTESGFAKSGALKYTNQYIEAWRSDGARMWEVKTGVAHQRRIFLPNGDEILINELLAKKSTYPKRFVTPVLQRDAQTSCFSPDESKAGSVNDGLETIGGFRTVKHRLTTTNRTMTGWYALDYNCALIQQKLEHETGVTVQSLASLAAGEPNRSLFDVPDNLQESPPSGLFVPICAGANCSTVPDNVKQRLDKNYNDIRNKIL